MPDEVTAAPLVRFELLARHIALVTLDRPEKRNAISPEVASALEAIVRRIEEDPDIRVAILTSSEPRVFCAGADLGAVASGKGPVWKPPAAGLPASSMPSGSSHGSLRLRAWRWRAVAKSAFRAT
jgi:enoyl-CoA hydratase/carnithine racemase